MAHFGASMTPETRKALAGAFSTGGVAGPQREEFAVGDVNVGQVRPPRKDAAPARLEADDAPEPLAAILARLIAANERRTGVDAAVRAAETWASAARPATETR